MQCKKIVFKIFLSLKSIYVIKFKSNIKESIKKTKIINSINFIRVIGIFAMYKISCIKIYIYHITASEEVCKKKLKYLPTIKIDE